MLKILGTFRVVPDLDLLSEEDWTVHEKNLVDTSFVKTIWNCFDESALEFMLRLSENSESLGIPVQLDAMTVGNSICENYLRTLYALGFEKAVRIQAEEELQFQPELIAALITEYWECFGGQDVIVMGQKSADGTNGKVPLLVAEKLGWPCVTQVMGISMEDETHLRVTSKMDDCVCTQTVKIPCVLVVGDVPAAFLRVPTLKDRMTKGKRAIETHSLDEFEVWKQWNTSDSSVCLVHMEAVAEKRDGILIQGDSVQEKVKLLYKAYLRERLEQL